MGAVRRDRGGWRFVLLGLLAAAALALAALLMERDDESEPSPAALFAACLEQGAPAGDPDTLGADCRLSKHPEPFAELRAASDGLASRVATDAPGAQIEAAKLAQGGFGKVQGTAGHWRPVGKGPLHADDPRYRDTYGAGFAELAGRISDYAYDRARDRVYASVASGGVWISRDKGRSWKSIGDSLPTQTVGSIAYSPAFGGTLVAVTGDGAFGGNTYGGLGVYWSSDNGRSWHRSRGVPNGAQGFKAAFDPTHFHTVYAATGAGLFRSHDAGKSFRNVNLPTGGRCQGNTFNDKAGCFFANTVTDVVVQAPDKYGHKGGAVLAVVGWRKGGAHDFDGHPMSPGNGLYVSNTGRRGTFRALDEDANGFAPQKRIGRVELGAATGPGQNHGYVYAIVQDAVLFNKGTLEGLDVPDIDVAGLTPLATPTYLNGVYVSDDFGRHWKLMVNDEEMLLPTSGSVLAQLTPLGFGPGIQAWYDEWIQPDPTRATAHGVPTRLVFGLEEIYMNTLPLAQNGLSNFKTIGPYNATGGPCLLVLATSACSSIHELNPDNTTTHPDQHAGLFIPDGEGGVTLLAGNDGGNYRQHVTPGHTFTKRGFGKGAQDGFHTLLPYGAVASSDGVVYAGLQDNGMIRISPNGYQVMTFGGDGIFALVHPRHSKIAYDELPGAGINVTRDGGKTWRDMDPFLDNASFYAPMVMDPKNPNHIVTAGREIAETTVGASTTSPGTSSDTDWHYVYDLGEGKYTTNQVSAVGISGEAVYAGFCGGCDVVRDSVKFANGLATNVGGKKPPNSNHSAGWHKAPARGLPSRFISSITVDPHSRRTIYVTLGASDLRPYAPPHALGDSGISSRGGHIYKSTNGGRSFHDISGNLEKVPALWSAVRQGQLIVATTVGVFAANGTDGGHYSPLGNNLPPAPVFQIQRIPGHPNQLLAASLGRGVYRYTFK